MGNHTSRMKYRACFKMCDKKHKDVTLEALRIDPWSAVQSQATDEVDSTSMDILTVYSVDLCLDENGTAHHTKLFDLLSRADDRRLVVRRGQSFRLKLRCNRPFVAGTDGISFIFTVADDDKPSHGNGTLVGATVKTNPSNLGDPLEWGVSIEEVHGDILEVLVKPSVAAPVTRWKLDIDTKHVSSGSKTFSMSDGFFLLFNPWCKEDQVYLPDTAELEEYIMADTTLIWRGSYNRPRRTVWKLGQFDRDILECSLLLIAKVGKISAAHRGDPVRTARALSAAVNSPDDDGAVLGNWTDDFSDGVAPTKWIGSTEIMQKYYRKPKPVKYGQCWVFAGVLSTISRAIGIPSRIVTNYSSAHDTQASLTVDFFVDENGKVMEEMNSDSIWNYHVWNELWMERPDLGHSEDGGYGGWQAVDATPQEQSDSLYRCGPASVKAVKRGEILRPYDCNFLFSEVNADKVFWKYSGPGQAIKLIKKDVLGIGLFINTKAIGKWVHEDITSNYKYAERSPEERVTMLKALRQTNSAFSRYYLNEEFNDVNFDLALQDDIKVGENFSVILNIKNRSTDKTHLVTGVLNAETVLYTGRERGPVKSISFENELKPNTAQSVRMQVTFEEYFNKLLDQGAFNISCMASVKETDYEYFEQADFRVRKPDIRIQLQGEPISRQEIDVILRLANPLPIPMRKGVFTVQVTGEQSPIILKVAEIPVGGNAGATFKYTPPWSGRGTIIAKFTCKEIDDIDGWLAFEIQPRPEDVLLNGSHRNEIVARSDVIP